MKLILTILLFAVHALSQVQMVDDISACNEGDVGKWSVATKKFICASSAASPGIYTFVITGTCPTGWTEDASLNGKMLFGTLAANGDVGNTGGSDSITPTVNSLTAAAQIFTGSSTTVPALTISWPVGVPTFSGSALSSHSHGVGTFANTATSAGTPAGTNASSAVSGIVVDNHASHTHTYTDVIAHTHTQTSFNTATGGSTGWTVDTSMSGTTATSSLATGSTGVATGTTAGPSATLTHNVSNNGTAAAQVFTGSALGTHNHTFSGSSESVSAGTPSGTISWPAGVPTNASGSLTPLGSNSTSAVTGTLNSFDNRSAYIKVIFCKRD